MAIAVQWRAPRRTEAVSEKFPEMALKADSFMASKSGGVAVEEWEEASYSRHLEDIFPGQGPGGGGNVSGGDGKVSREDFTTTVIPLLTLLTVLTSLTLRNTTVLRY